MDFFEKRRRIILTMYPLALSSHKTNHPYHDYRKNDINDYGLKSCIFVEVNVLLLLHPRVFYTMR
jgi:hypothetical protein